MTLNATHSLQSLGSEQRKTYKSLVVSRKNIYFCKKMKSMLYVFICMLFPICAMAHPIEPESSDVYATCINVQKAGTLSSLLTQEQKDTCSYLVIRGKLNSADIITLREMAGENGSLVTLDLSNVRIVSSKEPYLKIENAAKRVFIRSTLENDSWRTQGWSMSLSQESSRSRDVRFGTPDVNPYRNLNRGSARQYLPSYREMTYASNDKNSFGYQGRNARFYYIEPQIYLYESDIEGGSDENSCLKPMAFKGHRIKHRGERFILSAHTTKDTFCSDMFYQCPKLKQVYVPLHGLLDNRSFIVDSNIRFLEIYKQTD